MSHSGRTAAPALGHRASGAASKIPTFAMYVNGEWILSKSQETIQVINPATERVFAKVPAASRGEVKEALDAAREAQPKWEDTPPVQRASFLFKIAQLIRRDKERLANVLTSEQGKPHVRVPAGDRGSGSEF